MDSVRKYRNSVSQTAHQASQPCSRLPCLNVAPASQALNSMHRLPDDDVSSPLHPLVRTMADDFHGPRAEDLDQLHQLQKSTKRPAKGEQTLKIQRACTRCMG